MRRRADAGSSAMPDGRMSDHGEQWERSPRKCRSFTPEFKAEIVGLCQRGDRSIGQIAKDFDLTETAVRQWVKQAERDSGAVGDGGLTMPQRQELAQLRRETRGLREECGDPQAGHGFLRGGPGERPLVHRVGEALQTQRQTGAGSAPFPITLPRPRGLLPGLE